MSQQITITVLVDVQNALEQNTLEGNIYLIDNLRTDGSEGVGTGHLTTAVNGSYWSDYSQVYEVVINWSATALGSLPLTLPRSFYKERSDAINDQLIGHLVAATANDGLLKASAVSLQQTAQDVATTTFIRDEQGNIRDLDVKPLTVTGSLYQPGKDDPSQLSYLAPIINNITGPAVDEGVIYPCQQGTPVFIKSGWYWCATADTSKVGEYSYTMHMTLYKLVNKVYEPVKMTYDASIKVSTQPQVNGFTHAGLGVLPL